MGQEANLGAHPFISEELLAAKWPCSHCGAAEPCRETGHDPCIKNLPGVQYACCGHGRQRGYVAFSDGRVLRGEFEGIPAGPEADSGTIAALHVQVEDIEQLADINHHGFLCALAERNAAVAQVEALRKALEKIAAGHVFPYFIAREALALSAPAEEGSEAGSASALDIILSWYRELPQGARLKLSLHNLHTLSKQIAALASSTPVQADQPERGR